MPPKIIALGHRKRVGKDTIANFMIQYIDQNHPEIKALSIGLADAVKEKAHEVFKHVGLKSCGYYGLHEDEREQILPLCGKTPRQIWIGFAEYCRTIDPYCWIKTALDVPGDPDILIIRDFRTREEWEVFSDMENFKIRVDNPRVPPSKDAIDHLLDAYEFDREIMNSSSMKVLEHKTCKVMDSIMRKWYGEPE